MKKKILIIGIIILLIIVSLIYAFFYYNSVYISVLYSVDYPPYNPKLEIKQTVTGYIITCSGKVVEYEHENKSENEYENRKSIGKLRKEDLNELTQIIQNEKQKIPGGGIR